MADEHPLSAIDRIDLALVRIEAALADRPPADSGLADRHAVLKQRMAEAITALDAILATGAD
ncbi:hypothetical protein [Sphingomonas sp. 28-63-12]|uniref:hypothetical protein n=1 Tax=Sphingomonas sp. 28-63-12 TaxID=1970434 RepID=UPI000BCA3D38|nr:MAG: hypothetical protein B7Y47_16840 [Sphingomonas sp. 28-63-12]